MGFLRIGWQNYFNIMIFLLKYTYILICMWRNVRYNFFDLRLGSGYMCNANRLAFRYWDMSCVVMVITSEHIDVYILSVSLLVGQLGQIM